MSSGGRGGFLAQIQAGKKLKKPKKSSKKKKGGGTGGMGGMFAEMQSKKLKTRKRN